MVKRYELCDDQWEKIEHLLPGREETVGVTARDNRLFVEAVLYRYRAGIPWWDLPERFGDFRVIPICHILPLPDTALARVFERPGRRSRCRICHDRFCDHPRPGGSDSGVHRAIKGRLWPQTLSLPIKHLMLMSGASNRSNRLGTRS